MKNKITEYAKKLGYDGVEYKGRWENYDVYELVIETDEVIDVGMPQFLFVFENTISLAPEEFAFKYMDSIAAEEK